MCLIFEQCLTISPQKKCRIHKESHKNSISLVRLFSHLKRILVGTGIPDVHIVHEITANRNS